MNLAETRCKFCNSSSVVKRGLRRTRGSEKQIYMCASCKRRFTISALPNYTYPPAAILSAPVHYYQGYSLQATRDRIAARFKCDPSLAVVSTWVRDFGAKSAMRAFRDELIAFGKPQTIIARRLLKHRQNYLMQVHRFKLSRLPSGLSGVSSYVNAILTGAISIDPLQFTLRASSCLLGIPVPRVSSRLEYPCKIAAIALRAATTNYERHSVLQRFLLATDKTTVAVEVPVYLTSEETASIIHQPGGMLGHIDFLLALEYSVVILDYKPNAAKEKNVVQQLLLYAIALSKRTGLHLKQIQLAWFDENDYFRMPSLEAYSGLKAVLKGRQAKTGPAASVPQALPGSGLPPRS